MTNKTKQLSSILSLNERLLFDNATLATPLSPTYKRHCRLDPYSLYSIIQLITVTSADMIGMR